MITAKQKPLEEIIRMIAGCKKILIVGCGTCVTVTHAGGESEVKLLASALRMKKKSLRTSEHTVIRQCDPEFLDELKDDISDVDCVVSLGCGAGVQILAEKFPKTRVVPGIDTKAIGGTTLDGELTRMCKGCGDCILEKTVGICPKTRCAKGMLNGPCGGVNDKICEVPDWGICAWVLIFEKMKKLDMLEKFVETRMPKIK